MKQRLASPSTGTTRHCWFLLPAAAFAWRTPWSAAAGLSSTLPPTAVRITYTGSSPGAAATGVSCHCSGSGSPPGESLRQAAVEAGVSFSTLTRVEAGAQPDLATFTRLCAWLGVSPSRFFTPTATRQMSPLDQAITHLHADPRLTDDAANKISSVLRDLYDALAKEAVPGVPALACHLRAASVLRPGVPQRLADLLTDMNTELERLVEAGEL
ncbi:Helix-turn-helix domain protein [Streptomyces collinus]|nr:Helix-turn-helix domain protein [Streptomyces collinus]UJA14148.1 Helix-turn-helix domain protein [Streptomyces collinus]